MVPSTPDLRSDTHHEHHEQDTDDTDNLHLDAMSLTNDTSDTNDTPDTSDEIVTTPTKLDADSCSKTIDDAVTDATTDATTNETTDATTDATGPDAEEHVSNVSNVSKSALPPSEQMVSAVSVTPLTPPASSESSASSAAPTTDMTETTETLSGATGEAVGKGDSGVSGVSSSQTSEMVGSEGAAEESCDKVTNIGEEAVADKLDNAGIGESRDDDREHDLKTSIQVEISSDALENGADGAETMPSPAHSNPQGGTSALQPPESPKFEPVPVLHNIPLPELNLAPEGETNANDTMEDMNDEGFVNVELISPKNSLPQDASAASAANAASAPNASYNSYDHVQQHNLQHHHQQQRYHQDPMHHTSHNNNEISPPRMDLMEPIEQTHLSPDHNPQSNQSNCHQQNMQQFQQFQPQPQQTQQTQHTRKKKNIHHPLLSLTKSSLSKIPWDRVVQMGSACDFFMNCKYSMRQVEDEVREEGRDCGNGSIASIAGDQLPYLQEGYGDHGEHGAQGDQSQECGPFTPGCGDDLTYGEDVEVGCDEDDFPEIGLDCCSMLDEEIEEVVDVVDVQVGQNRPKIKLAGEQQHHQNQQHQQHQQHQHLSTSGTHGENEADGSREEEEINFVGNEKEEEMVNLLSKSEEDKVTRNTVSQEGLYVNLVSKEQKAEGHWRNMNPTLDMMLYRQFYDD